MSAKISDLVTFGGAPTNDGVITRDTPIGFQFASLSKKASIHLMSSRTWGRFNPNHWDSAYAAKTGLSAPIQTGEMTSAYITEMCVYHFGRHFFRGTRFQCKYIASVHADDTITTHGVVRDKQPDGDGVRFTVEVWAQDQTGEKKTVGTVEVSIDSESASK